MKEAARGFIGVARPQDRVALYALAHSLFWEVAPLTSNEDLLLERVEHLPVLSGLTPLFDTIVTSYAHELAGRPGERNALIVISDGVDNLFSIGRRFKPGVVGKRGLPSQVYYEELLEAAPRLDALLYPVLLMPSFDDDDKAYAGARATRDLFKDLAKATGGKVFTAPSLSSLEPIYDQVAEELRSVYSVGYYPRDQDFKGEWRGVQVKVKREGVIIRTRSGYLAR